MFSISSLRKVTKRCKLVIRSPNETQIKSMEHKNKMSVINAIRCKIISRAFAVIERKTPFVNIQKFKTAS